MLLLMPKKTTYAVVRASIMGQGLRAANTVVLTKKAFLRRVGVQMLLISQVKSRENNPFSFARDDKSYNSRCMMYDAHDQPYLEKNNNSPAAYFSKITQSR